MSFATLALISAVALLGPLLALPRHWYLPVMLGELAAGVVLGRTGANVLHPADPTFTFLANIGFALIMFVAGTHVPIRDARLRGALAAGSVRAVCVAAIAVPAGWAIANWFDTGHVALYAVLLASSSAAVVLPIVDSLRLTGEPVLRLLPQVAIADAACIVALPLTVDPERAGRAALGAALVIAAAFVLYVVLRELDRIGLRKRIHRVSEDRKYALEMRVHLAMLFALSAIAVGTHISIMLAGFCFGLAVSAVGEPRRLARQLFALTEGFLGPVFFVWLGASLDLRALATDPSYILLGAVLGAAAVGVHVAMRALGQPLAIGGLAAAQLGVPVAAVALSAQSRLLTPGESAAILLGALITVAVAAFSAARIARTQPPQNNLHGNGPP